MGTDDLMLPALPCGVALTRTASHLRQIDKDCETDAPDLEEHFPDSVFYLAHQGAMIGYVGFLPGEPGYSQICLYVAPVARNMGDGLKSLALGLGRAILTLGERLNFRAFAAHPKTPGQLRFGALIGGQDSGTELLIFGTRAASPILIWRRSDTTSAPEEIARKCLPKAFALEDEYQPQHYIRMTDELLAGHGVFRNSDLGDALNAAALAYLPERRVLKQNGQTFLVRPSAVAR